MTRIVPALVLSLLAYIPSACDGVSEDPAGDLGPDAADGDAPWSGEDAVPPEAGEEDADGETGTESATEIEDESGSGGHPDPSAPGPFLWITRDTTVVRGSRTTPVTAYLPVRESGALSPLVVFVPGFQSDSAWYAPLCERLASHGYAVARADPPDPLIGVNHVEMTFDVLATIDALLDPGGEFADRLDASRIAVSGHSLGGKIAVMAAFRDPRIGAVLALDPVNGGSPIAGYSESLPDVVPEEVAPLAIPLGFLGETTDGTGSATGAACAPADRNFRTFFEAAAASPWVAAWDFLGAGHMQFVFDQAACGFLCDLVCRAPEAEDDAVRAGTMTLAVAFLHRHFEADDSAEAWLSGALVPEGVVAERRP